MFRRKTEKPYQPALGPLRKITFHMANGKHATGEMDFTDEGIDHLLNTRKVISVSREDKTVFIVVDNITLVEAFPPVITETEE